MFNIRKLALAGLVGAAFGAPAQAQTTLTFSSWVPPTHHLTLVAGELGRRRREGDQRPRQVPDAAQGARPRRREPSTRCATAWSTCPT